MLKMKPIPEELHQDHHGRYNQIDHVVAVISRNARTRNYETNSDDAIQDSRQSLGQLLRNVLEKEEERILECQHGRHYEEPTLTPMDLLHVTKKRKEAYVSEEHNELTNQHHYVKKSNHYGSKKPNARGRCVRALWVDFIKEKLAAP